MIRILAATTILLTASAGFALAQDKEEIAPDQTPVPATINIFGQKAQVTVKMKQAMESGDAAGVLAAGGTPAEAFETLRARGIGRPGDLGIDGFITAFTNTADGGGPMVAGDINGKPSLTRRWPNGTTMSVGLDGKEISLSSSKMIMGPDGLPDFGATTSMAPQSVSQR